MTNKMAEFPEKLAIFGQNLHKTWPRSARPRGGGVQKISKLRGGYFGNFGSQGGYFGYTPLAIPGLEPKSINTHSH